MQELVLYTEITTVSKTNLVYDFTENSAYWSFIMIISSWEYIISYIIF